MSIFDKIFRNNRDHDEPEETLNNLVRLLDEQRYEDEGLTDSLDEENRTVFDMKLH